MLNMVDVAAVQLATCEGPERFFTWANELYSNHDAWMKPFLQMNEQSAAPLRQLPADQQVRGFAELGGLNAFARPRGLPKAKFDQCLTDVKAMEAKAARQQEAVKRYDLMGTPSFLINGEKVDGVTTWSGLQPKLQQAIG
jgi:2-hydroxychromene-2-carboxylate isomerase